jgi:hypothetical protein
VRGEDGERERRGHHRPEGEEHEAERRAERRAAQRGPRLRARQGGERGAGRGERRELGQRFVRVHQQPHRADGEQRRRGAGGAMQEPQRREHENAARQARRAVERQHAAQQLAEGERDPVVERRVLQPRLAGDARHHPVARQQHLVRDLDGDRVEALPRVVPRESREDERRRDEREHRGRGRQREAGDHVAILGPETKKAAAAALVIGRRSAPQAGFFVRV